MYTNDLCLYVVKSYLEQKPEQRPDRNEKIAMKMIKVNTTKNKKEKKTSLFGFVRNTFMGWPIPSDQNSPIN